MAKDKTNDGLTDDLADSLTDNKPEVTPPYDLPGDCYHAMPHYDTKIHRSGYRCGVDGNGIPVLVGDEEELRDIATDGTDCLGCPFFEDTRIRYPLTVRGIDIEEFDGEAMRGRDAPGTVVLVSFMEGDEKMLCMGILVGNLPLASVVSYDKEDGKLSVRPLTNPAIFVPSVGRIVWGCESWWHVTTIEDLEKAIDDEWQLDIARTLLSGQDGQDEQTDE